MSETNSSEDSPWPFVGPELVVFVLTSSCYFWLMASGVLWMDVGELSVSAFFLGGAHPPGHPGYSLLGKLACFLPIGEVATRLSILSALCMGAVLAGVARIVRLFHPSRHLLAVLCPLPVAMTPAFVINATRPEVYAPVFALLVWALVFALKASRPKDPSANSALTSIFLLALAAGFHPAIAMAMGLPLAATLVWAFRHRLLRLLGSAIGLVILAAMLYLYLPARALAQSQPPLVWGDPSTIDNFWSLVTASVYQGNFQTGSLLSQAAERLSLLTEGSGLLLCLLGTAGLVWASVRGLRGALPLLATLASVFVAASLQSAFNPDMRAYLGLSYVALALGTVFGAGFVTAALERRLNRRLPWAGLFTPVVVVALLAHWGADRQPDRSQDAMQLWDQTVAPMPPGPGVFLGSGDHLLFVSEYEWLVAGARPDIAIASPELSRDLWFLEHLRSQLPDLYLPYLDDGQKGQIAARLFAENTKRGRPVWADSLSLLPPHAAARGRAFELRLRASDEAPPPVPPPLAFEGVVGGKVSALTALRRAQFEAKQGRLVGALQALDLAVLVPESHPTAAVQPALYPHLPKVSSRFLHESYETELFAVDVLWQLGLPVPDRSGPRVEERTHAAWRMLLQGNSAQAESDLQSIGPPALAATTPMLLAIGQSKLAETRLRRQVSENPDDPNTTALLASLLGNLGTPESLLEAEALFVKASLLAPKNTETFVRLGLVYVKQGKTTKAREAWQRAIALDPTRNDVQRYLDRLAQEAP